MIKIIRTEAKIDLDGKVYTIYDMPVWVARDAENNINIPLLDVVAASSDIPEETLLKIGESSLAQIYAEIVKLSRDDKEGDEDAKKK